jgi:hypothetical protein
MRSWHIILYLQQCALSYTASALIKAPFTSSHTTSLPVAVRSVVNCVSIDQGTFCFPHTSFYTCSSAYSVIHCVSIDWDTLHFLTHHIFTCSSARSVVDCRREAAVATASCYVIKHDAMKSKDVTTQYAWYGEWPHPVIWLCISLMPILLCDRAWCYEIKRCYNTICLIWWVATPCHMIMQ